MEHSAPQHAPHPAKQWGVVGGTLWAAFAFLAPQFAAGPFIPFITTVPTDINTKQFLLQGLVEASSIGLIWLIMRHVYRVGWASIGLKQLVPNQLLWSVAAFPAYLVVSAIISGLADSLFSVNLDQTQDIGYANPQGPALVLIFVALVCLAPFVEEMLFRGFLFTAFRRVFGFWGGAVGVSLLFAIAHGQLNVGIDVFVLSLFLCGLREKTNSLWPAIGLHAIKNLVAFVVLFIIGAK